MKPGAYGEFARIYDAFIADGPQRAWIGWLTEHLPLAEMEAVDIGCGTGQVAIALAQVCRRVTGIDRSEDMLAEAAEAAVAARVRVDWLCQDMRQLHLPYPVDLAVSTCDSLNYLLTPEDVRAALSAVYAWLRPGGWFCFDLLGPARVEVLRQGVWYDVRSDAAVLFESKVADSGRILYDLTLFIAEEDERYRRVDEVHQQQYHRPADIRDWLAACGFQHIEVTGDFGNTPVEHADRLTVFARK